VGDETIAAGGHEISVLLEPLQGIADEGKLRAMP
jgi:hypothetical protein